MKNYKQLGLIAGLLFLISTGLNMAQTIISYSQLNLSGMSDIYYYVFLYGGSAIMWSFDIVFAIALMTDKLTLARVFSIILLVDSLFGIVSAVLSYVLADVTMSWYMILTNVASAIIFLFVTLSLFILGRKAKTLCFLAVGVFFCQLLLPILIMIMQNGLPSFAGEFTVTTAVGLINCFCRLAFYCFLGLYLEQRPMKRKPMSVPMSLDPIDASQQSDEPVYR